MTFLSGVFLSESSVPSEGRIVISVFVLLANLSFILYSMYFIYTKTIRLVRLSLQHHNISVEMKSHVELLSAWALHKFSALRLWLQENK